MRIPVYEFISGTTFRAGFVSSGDTATAIVSRLLDKNETLVNSTTGQSSGNGFYFALHTLPTTPGWFVNEWIAVINANTYINRQFVRGVHPEV